MLPTGMIFKIFNDKNSKISLHIYVMYIIIFKIIYVESLHKVTGAHVCFVYSETALYRRRQKLFVMLKFLSHLLVFQNCD